MSRRLVLPKVDPAEWELSDAGCHGIPTAGYVYGSGSCIQLVVDHDVDMFDALSVWLLCLMVRQARHLLNFLGSICLFGPSRTLIDWLSATLNLKPRSVRVSPTQWLGLSTLLVGCVGRTWLWVRRLPAIRAHPWMRTSYHAPGPKATALLSATKMFCSCSIVHKADLQ